MPSLLVEATGQAVALGALSNIIAQVFAAQKENKPFEFDISTFMFFLVWTLISCPPNVLFQIFLEEQFPGQKVDEQGQKSLSKRNTFKKFALDQTLSASLNTAGYIAAISAYRGKDFTEIGHTVQKDFWPLIQAGWRVWPLVALLNFTIIPLKRRTLFGGIVGLFWGVYMSLLAADS